MMRYGVTDNVVRQRYELTEKEHIVFADYTKDRNILTIQWVQAPPELRGTGAASRLMEAVAEEAKEKGWSIVPICGYAASWLKRHGEYRVLVD